MAMASKCTLAALVALFVVCNASRTLKTAPPVPPAVPWEQNYTIAPHTFYMAPEVLTTATSVTAEDCAAMCYTTEFCWFWSW